MTARASALILTGLLALSHSAWSHEADGATPPGPVPGTRLSDRVAAFGKLPEPGLGGGIVPIAPPKHLAMLTDYIEPAERDVACPNQDVVYGSALLALDREPVVVQVPDTGDRFWVYQVVDQRTDSFAELGKMYGTKPGFRHRLFHAYGGGEVEDLGQQTDRDHLQVSRPGRGRAAS